MKKISIYGIGNFGFALLNHLSRNKNGDFELHAYDRDREVTKSLKDKRCHPYFHGQVRINDKIVIDGTIDELIVDCDILVLAVISSAVHEVVSLLKNKITKPLIILDTAKALDFDTGKRLSEVVAEELKGKDFVYAALAGGTIAADLLKENPLGADIACEDEEALKVLITVFSARSLTVYPTKDLIGLEYAGALKNVISILAGMINGMGFSYGSETHVISRAAEEIERLIVQKFKADPATFSMKSQCWGNDLWMSCTGKTRNREFGVLLGQGKTVAEALKIMAEQRKTVEGVNTIKVLDKLHDLIKYPLLKFIYDFVITGDSTLDDLKDIIYFERY